MIGLASQRQNLATLMEMKPKRFSLGRNPLSDAPHRNPGVVENGQGPGRHPQVARRIVIWIRWQVSEDRVVASLVARYIGVVEIEKGLRI